MLSFIACNRGRDLVIVSEWDDGRILVSNTLSSASRGSYFFGNNNKDEESLDYTTIVVGIIVLLSSEIPL